MQKRASCPAAPRGRPGYRRYRCQAASLASHLRGRCSSTANWRIGRHPQPRFASPCCSKNRRFLHSALAFDRARGPLRRRDPEAAVRIWEALVAGRWSLLDHFDSDGRRFIVAHRNDAEVADARGLTHRERQVVAQVALGQSNKMIAYELGLSTSTVANHLASARAKLGLPSAAALRQKVSQNGDSFARSKE